MPNGVLADEYWLSQQLRQIRAQLSALASSPVLANASSDGVNGWMKISNAAVNQQPAIEFHYTGGGGDLLAQIYETTAGAIQITGGLQVSGTKNFVMNHPTKPGYVLRHASTESPVNGVEYWGTVTLGAAPAGLTMGSATVTLPAYFEALTKPANRVVELSPQTVDPAPGADPVIPVCAATAVTSGAFTIYGTPGAVIGWLVKAERASQPGDWPIDFAAEEQGEVPGPPASNATPDLPSSPMTQ